MCPGALGGGWLACSRLQWRRRALPAAPCPSLTAPFPHPPSTRCACPSFNHFIGSDLLKIIRAKGNERVTCDADPNFYLR